MSPMMIGRTIAAARELRGVNQKELAKRVHIPVYTLGKIERGQRPPKADEVFVIADVLDVPLEWFQNGPPWLDPSDEDLGAWLNSLLTSAA